MGLIHPSNIIQCHTNSNGLSQEKDNSKVSPWLLSHRRPRKRRAPSCLQEGKEGLQKVGRRGADKAPGHEEEALLKQRFTMGFLMSFCLKPSPFCAWDSASGRCCSTQN